jgi:hypothetical protein
LIDPILNSIIPYIPDSLLLLLLQFYIFSFFFSLCRSVGKLFFSKAGGSS